MFYLLFSILLLTSWRGRLQGGLLVLLSIVSTIWSALCAMHAGLFLVAPALIWMAETLRILVILVFLSRLLEMQAEGNVSRRELLRRVRYLIIAVCSLLLLPVERWLPNWSFAVEQLTLPDFRFVAYALLAVAGLVLVEQVYRNTPLEHRWGIKFLSLGLGASMAFDFYLFSDAMLFNRLDQSIWQARGVVNTLVVPLLGVSAARNPQWSLDFFVSRKIVFHTTAIFATGIYLLTMAMAGYYIRLYGGEWSRVLEIVFMAGAIAVLLVLLFSGQIRSRLKVFISKNFFSYKYDYREEWLRLIAILNSQRELRAPLSQRVIYALCESVDSPGGVLWVRADDGSFRFEANWGIPADTIEKHRDTGSLTAYFQATEWVINLQEYVGDPEFYEGLDLPDWMQSERFWLIVPLFHEAELHGFVMMEKPRAPQNLDWETVDLLKTAGRQAASYLILEKAANALAEARQFEGFNRLSAFVMHDLKNLIAQLSLVAKNAEKHKHNPEFIDDSILTIQNSVGKMNRLMAQLRGVIPDRRTDRAGLVETLTSAVEDRSKQLPAPVLHCEPGYRPSVYANRDRLSSVIEHVIQNGQEATSATGHVWVRLKPGMAGQALIEVEDDGTGMDPEFVRTRLFKPFDSTKGLTGMGVGAYECREFVTAMGGSVEVESTPGKGTLFSIILPSFHDDVKAEGGN